MSHELRTPLNAIIGCTGTLLMRLPGPLNAAQEKQLQPYGPEPVQAAQDRLYLGSKVQEDHGSRPGTSKAEPR